MAFKVRRVVLAATALSVACILPAAAAEGDGTLTGRVAGAGIPLAQLNISVDWGEETIPVGADGHYAAELSDGYHTLELVHPGTSGARSLSVELGEVQVVADTTTTRDIDFTLVRGTVTGAGKPLNRAAVTMEQASGAERSTASVETVRGSYRLLAEVDGIARVLRADDNSGKHVSEYYQDAATWGAAKRVTLSAAAVSTIDFDLDPYARIKGSVALPKGATHVDRQVALLTRSGRQVGWGNANRKGSYVVSGLLGGSYVIAFGRASGIAMNPATYYRSSPETPGVAKAPVVKLRTGQVLTLHRSGQPARPAVIAGRVVTKKAGKSIGRAQLRVVAVPTKRGLSTRSALTDKRGRFAIRGLAAGTYRVSVWNSAYPTPGQRPHRQASLGQTTVKAGETRSVGDKRFDVRLVR